MADLATNVANYAWYATTAAPGDEHSGFLYPTGLGATFEHPEIILFGLDASLAHRLCSYVVADSRVGSIAPSAQRG